MESYELDWSKMTNEQARTLLGLMKGELTLCHGCYATVPANTVKVIGVLEEGDERHLCQKCASEERNWARTPDEECLWCGVIRAKLGSDFCSQSCQEKMEAFEKAQKGA